MTTEQYRTRSGLSIFLSFFRPHRGLFFLDLACALVVALIDLAYPIVSRYAMRTLLPQNAYRAFFTVMLVVVAAYARCSTLSSPTGAIRSASAWRPISARRSSGICRSWASSFLTATAPASS